MDVIALEESVGGERASAGAVSARVGEEDCEYMGEEELSVSEHADAVVAEAVEQENSVAVRVMRADGPGAEGGLVGGGDGCVGEVGVEGVSGVLGGGDFFGG